jgi:hypothetical protein
MSRAESLAAYRPIRAGIQRVLKAMSARLPPADIRRATKLVVPWADDATWDQPGVNEMVGDVALFEPNQRGGRAFDKLRADPKLGLSAEDLALAARMSGAFFSIFRAAARDRQGGWWLEDLLAGDRRVLLMDEAAEGKLHKGMVLAGRVFDAGPFHCAFGLLVQPEEDMLAFCVAAARNGERLPVRGPLSARIYQDGLVPPLPPKEEIEEALRGLLEMVAKAPPPPRRRRS